MGVNSEGARSSRQTMLCAREEKAGRWGRFWAGWTPRTQFFLLPVEWSQEPGAAWVLEEVP